METLGAAGRRGAGYTCACLGKESLGGGSSGVETEHSSHVALGHRAAGTLGTAVHGVVSDQPAPIYLAPPGVGSIVSSTRYVEVLILRTYEVDLT